MIQEITSVEVSITERIPGAFWIIGVLVVCWLIHFIKTIAFTKKVLDAHCRKDGKK